VINPPILITFGKQHPEELDTGKLYTCPPHL